MVSPAEFPTHTMAVTPTKNDSPPWNGPKRSHRKASPSASAVRSPASTLTRKSLGGLYAGIFCGAHTQVGWARTRSNAVKSPDLSIYVEVGVVHLSFDTDVYPPEKLWTLCYVCCPR